MNNLIRMDDYKSEDSKMNYVCSTHYRYNDLDELTVEGQIDILVSESS